MQDHLSIKASWLFANNLASPLQYNLPIASTYGLGKGDLNRDEAIIGISVLDVP